MRHKTLLKCLQALAADEAFMALCVRDQARVSVEHVRRVLPDVTGQEIIEANRIARAVWPKNGRA